MYLTSHLEEILKRRLKHKEENCGFVFHVEGKPLNYGTIQLNYRKAQRLAKIPYTGTHILRHGMATLARRIGGGLDAVVAMTGHKDLKLADHYSSLDDEFQKEVSLKISKEIDKKVQSGFNQMQNLSEPDENVLSFAQFRERKVSNLSD